MGITPKQIADSAIMIAIAAIMVKIQMQAGSYSLIKIKVDFKCIS